MTLQRPIPPRVGRPIVLVSCCIALLLVGLALAASPAALADTDNVTEQASLEPVPEPGDPYFEAEDSDGEWISYLNPRDAYRDPFLGGGSGKVCLTLLNEAGDPIVGETLPDTTVEIPTGESIAWHPDADPLRVPLPLTTNYERPLDSDQFGTSSGLPHGDGYLDAHCIEFHGLATDATVTYGEANAVGAHADRLEVVGYVQQAGEAWDSSVDPIADASPHTAVGGWTFEPGASHGQVVVVMQLVEEDDGAAPPQTHTDSTTPQQPDPNAGLEPTMDMGTSGDAMAQLANQGTGPNLNEGDEDVLGGLLGPSLALGAVVLGVLATRRIGPAVRP